MEYAAIVAAAASVIGALVSAGKEAEAQALRDRIAAEYGPEILPDLDQAMAEAQSAPTAYASNREGDDMRREQLDVLDELDNVYQTGGQTEADQAAYNQAGRQVAQRASQRAGDISVSAARRGQTGGPLGAVLESQSGQDELEALASLDADVASAGRNRALQALMGRGSLASGVRGDDWRAISAENDATDLMNRFNATQRGNVRQQGFTNNMNRLGAQGAARSGQAAGLDRSAEAARQTAAGIGNSALSFGSAWDEKWGEKPDKDEDE